MRSVLRSSFSLLLASSLAAQATFTVKTRGEYGVVAQDQTQEVVDGLADDLVIAATTDLSAAIAGAASRCTIRPTSSSFGRGVLVEERGQVANSDLGTRLAATLDEEGKGPQHAAPHTLTLLVEGSSATTGIVTITWSAFASENAEAACAIDWNDDGTPDFEAEANERGVVREFPVQRVGDRFVIHLTTECEAEIVDAGRGNYSARLGVYFREGGACRGERYGEACGAHLSFRFEGLRDLVFTLTEAPANAFGVTVVGARAADLPLGPCRLLVLPMAVSVFRTDRAGQARHVVRVPGEFDLRWQDVILASRLATTEAWRVQCQ